MVLKVTTSDEEGCERLWAVNTKEVIGDGNGNFSALRIADVACKTNADGVRMFSEVTGSERVIPCELALLAMGFLYPDKSGIISELELELDNRGNVRTAPNDYQTKLHKVFACGDMRRGQSLIVHAISEGRECARKVDEYLMGSTVLPR